MSEKAPLLPLVRRFFENDAAAATRVLETMEESDALAVLRDLPSQASADACRYLRVEHAAALLREATPTTFAAIVAKLDPVRGAAILARLTPETRERFLAALSAAQKRRIQELLVYPEHSVGRIMTSDLVSFRSGTRVGDVLDRLRQLANRQALSSYTYVTDDDQRLVGVINMRDLLLADADVTLDSVMRRDVFSVDCFATHETVAQELTRRHFFAAPVVDPEGRLLGLVKSDQLIGTVQQEATEDLQKMFGAGADERAFSSVGFSLRKRLPWLHVNLATAFLAASVVAFFEDVIARVTVLAVFLPVVAGQGGNAGAQSLAVVMRGLVMREIPDAKIVRLLSKEATIGLVNGVVIGAVTAGAAWLWNGNPFLGIVIGLAMIVNLVAAGLAGATIPLTMRAVGLDPAQSSNIILTTVTDVVGFMAFLGFAMLFEARLV